MKALEMFSLSGKTAVLTGGRGLYGRQIAEALYEAGAKVVMGSRDLTSLSEAAFDMRNAGGDVTALRLDLGSEASILEFAELVGPADILVNNAVARTMSGYGNEASLFDESMRINATGLFIITRAFGGKMIERNGGSIINVASIHGMIAPDPTLYEGLGLNGFIPDYFFHKGGMIEYTKFLASYYGPYNIRCNAVSPGGLRSPKNSEEFAGRYGRRTMLGRMAGKDDLKGAIVFLASDASSYVAAANLPVDGGYIAR